jgi:hypothetical protein
MRRAFNPFEILRRLNPVDPETLPDPSRSPETRRLMEAIIRDNIQREAKRSMLSRLSLPNWTRRRRYLLALIALTALGIAAAAWALTRGGGTGLTIGCYQRPALEAKTIVVAATGEAPVAICRRQWLIGALGERTPPPPLRACVLPSGAIGVFPNGGNVCLQLGLSAASPQEPSTAIRLKEALVDKFLAAGCVSQREATALVKDELRRLALTDWDITVTAPFSQTRPCASLAFDEHGQRVLLVPLPRR